MLRLVLLPGVAALLCLLWLWHLPPLLRLLWLLVKPLLLRGLPLYLTVSAHVYLHAARCWRRLFRRGWRLRIADINFFTVELLQVGLFASLCAVQLKAHNIALVVWLVVQPNGNVCVQLAVLRRYVHAAVLSVCRVYQVGNTNTCRKSCAVCHKLKAGFPASSGFIKVFKIKLFYLITTNLFGWH